MAGLVLRIFSDKFDCKTIAFVFKQSSCTTYFYLILFQESLNQHEDSQQVVTRTALFKHYQFFNSGVGYVKGWRQDVAMFGNTFRNSTVEVTDVDSRLCDEHFSEKFKI